MVPQTSSDDCGLHEGLHEGKEGEYRLKVVPDAQRLEYWQKDLTNTLVTSIAVATVNSHLVAYLGTSDGRHIQVNNLDGSQHTHFFMGVFAFGGFKKKKERKRHTGRKSALFA